MTDGVVVQLPKILRLGIRVRERLKVDDELVGIESLPDVVDAFAHLMADGSGFDGRRRTKRVVVAVGAAADGNRSVAIGTRESRVHDHFVDALAKLLLEPAV